MHLHFTKGDVFVRQQLQADGVCGLLGAAGRMARQPRTRDNSRVWCVIVFLFVGFDDAKVGGKKQLSKLLGQMTRICDER